MTFQKPALIVLLVILPTLIFAQTPSPIQSGPMVGYSEMREVSLWIQTKAPSRVYFEYWDKSRPDVRYTTREIITERFYGNTCELIADQVMPGKIYNYAVYVNSEKIEFNYPLEFQTQTHWKWRTDPPQFTFATGSCAYINDEFSDRPGKSYGGKYQIFQSIHKKRPDAMIWLGDNVYFREPDWNTRTGMIYRYTHTRSLPEMQPLLGSTHHYAIWDDHDYGPNNSDRSFWNKNLALDVFKLFWSNPSYGIDGLPGVTTTFQWGDADVFLLDNRFFRSPNKRKTGKRTMLGEGQLQWLIDALCFSQATFKLIVIGGQVLNPLAVHETYATFNEERELIIEEITKNNIAGVFFITGDRHHTELTKIERPNTYPLYDLTVSPLTSGAHLGAKNEKNPARVKGTLVIDRNFATLTFSGTQKNRKLIINVFDADGKKLWTQTIHASDLK